MPWWLGSRVRVMLVVLGLLMVLDLGRSIYARIGYARPMEIWQPAPTVYADLTWPPGMDLPLDTPRGQRLYAQRCAVCHGPDGRGNGPAAPSLMPRPRDFTLGQFKYQSTPAGQPPSDADLLRVVAHGLQASAMPYWQDLLSDGDMREVVAYMKRLSPVFDGPPPEPLVIPPRVPPDAASLARGRDLYIDACGEWHGPDGRGQVTMQDAKGYPVITRDLTAPWTFRGGSEPEQVWLRLTTGMTLSPYALICRRHHPRGALGSGELRPLDGPHPPLGARRHPGWPRPTGGPGETRRVPRPCRDVRAVSHPDQPYWDLPR